MATPAVPIEVTSRVELPDGVRLRSNTLITVVLDVKQSAHTAEFETTIEPSVVFERTAGAYQHVVASQQYEMDGVIQWRDLPNLAEDLNKWDRYRKHFLKNNSDLLGSYLAVAVDTILRRWRFKMYFGGEGTEFHILRGPHDIIIAKCGSEVEKFFDDEPLRVRARAIEVARQRLSER